MDEDEYYFLKPIEPKNKPMKTLVVVILCGVVAIPIVSGLMHGFNWEVWSFLGLAAFLGLIIIVVNKIKGTRPF
jgi:hypothetical protein